MMQMSEIKNILTEVWRKNKFTHYEELIIRVDNHRGRKIKGTVQHQIGHRQIFDFVQRRNKPFFCNM